MSFVLEGHTLSPHEKLRRRFEKDRWLPSEVEWLAKNLPEIREVQSGFSQICRATHAVDMDADPLPYRNFRVAHHRKGGMLILDDLRLKTYVSRGQRNGCISGQDIFKRTKRSAANVNLLEYYKRNPGIIPGNLRFTNAGDPLYLFYMGTLYEPNDSQGEENCDLIVRFSFFTPTGTFAEGHRPLLAGCQANVRALVLC